MKVFLDECVPVPLARLLNSQEVHTSKSMGWETIQNGALLKLVASEFDIFVTSDLNIRYQQNLHGYDLAIVELSTNNFRRIKNALQIIEEALSVAETGNITRVEIPTLTR